MDVIALGGSSLGSDATVDCQSDNPLARSSTQNRLPSPMIPWRQANESSTNEMQPQARNEKGPGLRWKVEEV